MTVGTTSETEPCKALQKYVFMCKFVMTAQYGGAGGNKQKQIYTTASVIVV